MGVVTMRMGLKVRDPRGPHSIIVQQGLFLQELLQEYAGPLQHPSCPVVASPLLEQVGYWQEGVHGCLSSYPPAAGSTPPAAAPPPLPAALCPPPGQDQPGTCRGADKVRSSEGVCVKRYAKHNDKCVVAVGHARRIGTVGPTNQCNCRKYVLVKGDQN